jgi:murein hydrolase activator
VTYSLASVARILLSGACLLGAPLVALAQETPSGRLEAMERVSADLVKAGKLIQLSEGKLGQIEARLGELDAQEQTLRGALEQRHGAISSLLAALQRMGRNPPPVMITRREDALTMVRSAMLLSSAFPELRVQAEGLSKELRDLAGIIRTSRAEGDKLKAEKIRYDEVRVRLAALQDEKRRFSSNQQQAELQSVRQEVARISRNVDEMSDLLQRLDKEVGARLPAPPPPPATPLQPAERKAAAVLAPSGDKVAMLATNRLKSNIPFDQAKGTLQLPSQGVRTVSFGQKTAYGTLSKGIYIQARYGGTVIAPCDGLIVYAGEFRTYGQLLIISPGGGYHILLAGLSQIDVQVGQSVLMGEPVGSMSTAVKSQAAQDSGPVLQVEFRKDQKPVDPDPWWSDASRKVQG